MYYNKIVNSCICILLIHSHTTFFFFFFNDTATTEIYTLSLHDALPILARRHGHLDALIESGNQSSLKPAAACSDRKSTRLNSSHLVISYAVFCLKKKKKRYALSHSCYDKYFMYVLASP